MAMVCVMPFYEIKNFISCRSLTYWPQHHWAQPGSCLNHVCVPNREVLILAFSALFEHPLAERVLKLACLVSLVSVCLHTPRTLQLVPNLSWILLVVDGVVVVIFTSESFARINNLGFIRVRINCHQLVSQTFPASRLLFPRPLVPIRFCAFALPLGFLASSHLPALLNHLSLTSACLLRLVGRNPLCSANDYNPPDSADAHLPSAASTDSTTSEAFKHTSAKCDGVLPLLHGPLRNYGNPTIWTHGLPLCAARHKSKERDHQ